MRNKNVGISLRRNGFDVNTSSFDHDDKGLLQNTKYDNYVFTDLKEMMEFIEDYFADEEE